MVLLQIFIQAFTVGLSGAVMPGPLLTYTIQLASKKGFRVGPEIVLGHAVLEAALIIAVIAGLGQFLTLTATKIGLWLIGGGLLAWMGIDLLWKESRKPAVSPGETAVTSEMPSRSGLTNIPPFGAGILISGTNPYWALWWATIGLGFITQAIQYGWIGIGCFYLGHILADLGWYSLVSAAIAKGRKYITPRIYQMVLIICGICLLLIAIGFIRDALRALGWLQL